MPLDVGDKLKNADFTKRSKADVLPVKNPAEK